MKEGGWRNICAGKLLTNQETKISFDLSEKYSFKIIQLIITCLLSETSIHIKQNGKPKPLITLMKN